MSDPMKVILVYSTSHAIKVEKKLKERDIDCKLVPVPRSLSSDCGICVRFRARNEGTVKKIVEEMKIETQGIFAL